MNSPSKRGDPNITIESTKLINPMVDDHMRSSYTNLALKKKSTKPIPENPEENDDD